MRQKIQQQYRINLTWLVATGVLALVLSATWSPLWLAVLLPVVLVAGQRLMRLECELCRDPLLYREQRFFGVDVSAWWPTLPTHCQTCEHPVA
jgi:hypothetical protein